jgi:hypothetical protein
VRGADVPGSQWSLPGTELSPPARGRHLHRRHELADLRAIPACTGQLLLAAEELSPACTEPTSGSGTLTPPTQSYPRVRKADSVITALGASRRGLSPGARGRHQLRPSHGNPRGAIPACAGPTRRPSSSAVRARSYTRVCGPTAVSTRWYTARRSYPRVRGADVMLPPPYTALKELSLSARRRLAVAAPLVGLAGAIPACAGSTRTGP